MAKLKAPQTTTVAFRVDEKIKQKVEQKYNTFEKRKVMQLRFRELYATLLQK